MELPQPTYLPAATTITPPDRIISVVLVRDKVPEALLIGVPGTEQSQTGISAPGGDALISEIAEVVNALVGQPAASVGGELLEEISDAEARVLRYLTTNLTAPEIAADEGLSVPYAAKLLAVLRQNGLIESVRGRSGGYRLAAAPAEISLGAVMAALGEPLFDEPTFCNRHTGTETSDGRCVHIGGCTLRALWHTLEEWMRRALDRITLADLLQGEGRLTELLRARLAEAVLRPEESPLPLISLTTAPNNEVV